MRSDNRSRMLKPLSPLKLILFLLWLLGENKIKQRLEESIIYKKVLFVAYVDSQMLEHCFVS